MTAAPQDNRWIARVGDAINWLFHSTLSTIVNAPRTFRQARPRERMRLAIETMWIVLFVMIGAAGGGAFAWSLVVIAALSLVSSISDIEDDIHERERVLRMLQAKPSGAPSVAVLPCPNGEHPAHRWVYTPGGWQDAGSASGHGPNITIREARRG